MAGFCLIEEARRIAAARSTTLNAEFRQWLADYVGRKQRAERALETLRELSQGTERNH